MAASPFNTNLIKGSVAYSYWDSGGEQSGSVVTLTVDGSGQALEIKIYDT